MKNEMTTRNSRSKSSRTGLRIYQRNRCWSRLAFSMNGMPMLSGNAGAVLSTSLLILVLITGLSLAVLMTSVNALKFTNRERYAAEAFNIAESGAGETILWLQQQSAPPANLTSFTPTQLAGDQAVGSGTFQTTIYPDAANNANYLKTYRIVTVGTSGPVSRTMEVVWRQGSFGQYAYFTDQEKSSTGSAIWWKAGEICDGPAHSNNANGSDFQINYNNSTGPIFLDMLTASSSSINYSPSDPTTAAQFNKIYSMGAKGYMLQTPVINLPATSDVQKTAAWGVASGYPSTTGVYLRTNNAGGIYIVGDSTVTLSRDSSARQVIAIKQGSKTTTITVDLAGTVTVTGPVGTGSATSSTIVPNGVIYSTGNITALKGEITDNRVVSGAIATRSAWTIATDVSNNKDITIADNLYYHTDPDKTKPASDPANLAAGTLGLVARNIPIPTTAPANLQIDAVMMAGGSNTTAGSFQVTSYDSRTPVGTLSINGGVIQKIRGAVGTFNASTGQTSTGYTKNYHYDPRLATNPPPFYPTTGTYDKLSWRLIPN
jgi:hypothetical protein